MRWETRQRGVTRIPIADDHEVVRAGLRRMLESQDLLKAGARGYLLKTGTIS
jgi:hypothetical protein